MPAPSWHVWERLPPYMRNQHDLADYWDGGAKVALVTRALYNALITEPSAIRLPDAVAFDSFTFDGDYAGKFLGFDLYVWG